MADKFVITVLRQLSDKLSERLDWFSEAGRCRRRRSRRKLRTPLCFASVDWLEAARAHFQEESPKNTDCATIPAEMH